MSNKLFNEIYRSRAARYLITASPLSRFPPFLLGGRNPLRSGRPMEVVEGPEGKDEVRGEAKVEAELREINSIIISVFLVSLFCVSIQLFSCVPKQTAQSYRPTVFVSILPQKYFVDRITGGLVNCLVMVPPGTNAHSYEPHPLQMSLLSKSRAYFAIGLEFEGPWLPKFSALAPRLWIVHTDSMVPKSAMAGDVGQEGDTSAHHEHGGLDPHIWLSPRLVKLQAASIENALEKIDTAHAKLFQKNLSVFMLAIDSLEKQLRLILPCDSSASPSGRRTFLVFHPTWGYFARDFCLTQISIEVEGKEPSPRTMKEILDIARKNKIRTVFTQPEFSRKSAEVIAHELGASVVEADALAYDWKNNLLDVAKKFGASAP